MKTILLVYQRVLEHVLSKVDFPICTTIYMLPSNLNCNLGNTARYKKLSIRNADMKIDSKGNINKTEVYRKQSTKSRPHRKHACRPKNAFNEQLELANKKDYTTYS